MKFRVLRYALIIITLVSSLSVFSEEFGTGLNFEPYDLYSSIPLKQVNFPTSVRGLPIKVDLREQLPPAGFQGKQGSCVAFATSYAVQSYYEFLSRRKFFSDWNSLKIGSSINPKTVFSPAFVHSSLTKGRDTGVTYFDALNFLTNVGSVPWERMPYDPLNFQKPDPKLNELAENYRIRSFRRVNFLNIEEIKSFLANREPVLVGIIVYSNLQELKAHEVYSNHSGRPLGGHAVVLVGYDDEKNAFLFLNSWGSNWADSGYGWIDYNWYLKTARVGYVILGDKGEFVSRRNETAGNFSIQISRILEPPSEIFATQGNYSDKVILTWEKVPNALGYEIYRSFTHEDSFSKIGVTASNQFIDDGVISDIAYSYKIVTLSDNQTSSLSNQKIIGFASKNAKDIPAKITGLKASNNLSDRIRLDWDELEFGVTGYQIYKWDIKTKTFKTLAKVQASWYEDKNASKTSFETYIVAGLNKNLTGIPSNSITGKISLERKLETPKEVYATQGVFADKVILSWKKVLGAKEYLVYVYQNERWEVLGQTSKLEFVHTTNDRVKNIYVVQAVDENGNYSDFSEAVIGFIEPKLVRGFQRLSPPRFVSIRFTKATVTLDWSEVQNAEGYNIWLKRLGEPKWNYWGRVQGGSRTSYMIDLPEKDIVYLFSITAIADNFQESEFSLPVTATYSIAKKSAQPRAFPSLSKIERIKGTWMGTYWESFTAKNLVLRIETQENSIIKINLNDKKTYEGKYVPDSNEIEVEGKLRIRLESLRTLVVEVKDKSITNENLEVAFLRE